MKMCYYINMRNASNNLCEDILLFLGRIKHELIVLAEERELTVMQLFALFAINRQGEVPMGKMAELLHCDASNITGIVDRLVHRNLVLRNECEHDRRTKMLQLTRKGKMTVEELMQSVPDRIGCNRLSLAEQHTFQEITQKISV